MSAKAGEIARESGVYRCERCSRNTTVQVGLPIRECEHCGHTSFVTGWRSVANERRGEAVLDGVT